MSVYGIPDEVYLRNRLDHLNQNSHYGIMIDTEITDIVRRHIKRLEEMKMKATSTEEFKDIIAIDFELQTFPNSDVQDKFIVSATNRDDIFAFVFEGPNIVDACRKTGLFADWEKNRRIKFLEAEIGRWKKEAADCLRLRDEAQKEACKLKKENEKYEEKIKKLEHDDMLDKNAADYWSKEHDILLERFAKLQVENEKLKDKVENLKKHVQYHIDDKGKLIKRNDKLREELALEKAANEAQHKFIREYAGKGTEVQFNYAIDDAKEVSYVIVDRKENERIKENLQSQHKMILELNKANCENCADEEAVDNVNHPSHYTGRYECIDVMQDVFGDEATNNFCLCNAFKYIWRARKKNGLEDVKKAVWYLNKYIEEAEKDGVPKGK